MVGTSPTCPTSHDYNQLWKNLSWSDWLNSPHILTPEARQKPMDIKDMYIDLGVDSKEEVESLGIRPGDMITTYIEYCKMANEKYLLAKAWDDCIGCVVAIEVLHHLKDENHSNIVYGVGTVQEDVGCSGALTTSQMINSSIVFALDVGLAGDVPGVTNQIQVTGGATDASKIHLVHEWCPSNVGRYCFTLYSFSYVNDSSR